MTTKKFTSYIVWIATISAIFFFVVVLRASFVGVGTANGDSGVAPPPPQATSTEAVPRGFKAPVRLAIPSISVNAKVQEVGLTKDNIMSNPTNFVDVGWYKYGTIPGETGSAVIAGHVDNALALPGVFKYLKNVKIGDHVEVTDKDGTTITFKVTSIDHYRYDEAPAEEIFNAKGKTLLRLITCGGKWIKTKKTYDERLVVTAEYIP